MAALTEGMEALTVSDEEVERKLALIKKNLQEVIGEDKLKAI